MQSELLLIELQEAAQDAAMVTHRPKPHHVQEVVGHEMDEKKDEHTGAVQRQSMPRSSECWQL